MFMKRKILGKKPLKRKGSGLPMRKRRCRFCADANNLIDYKEVKPLEGFIKERGKIISRRFSGNCARHQRKLADAIKKGRFLGLLAYTRY